jgi:hypothetical protein
MMALLSNEDVVRVEKKPVRRRGCGVSRVLPDDRTSKRTCKHTAQHTAWGIHLFLFVATPQKYNESLKCARLHEVLPSNEADVRVEKRPTRSRGWGVIRVLPDDKTSKRTCKHTTQHSIRHTPVLFAMIQAE